MQGLGKRIWAAVAAVLAATMAADPGYGLAPRAKSRELVVEDTGNVRANDCLRALGILGIKDDLNGHGIAGTPVSDWFYRRQTMLVRIFAAFGGDALNEKPDSWAERDQRRMYTDVLRSWGINAAKAMIDKNYIAPTVNEPKAAQERALLQRIKTRHLEMARHTYFVKNHHHKPIPKLTPEPGSEDEALVKALRRMLFEAVRAPYYLKKRRWGKTDDIAALRLWDLPIWAEDGRGHIMIEAMAPWVGTQTKAPTEAWDKALREGRVKSLAEITGLKNPPKPRTPILAGEQISLFDLIDNPIGMAA